MKLLKKLTYPVYFYLLMIVVSPACYHPAAGRFSYKHGILDSNKQWQGGTSKDEDIVSTPSGNFAMLVLLELELATREPQ